MKINPVLVLLLLLLSCSTQGDQENDHYSRPAYFKIHDEPVARNLTAFTATIGGFGNNLIYNGSGFEPVVYRNKYTALNNSQNSVIVNASQLTHHDTLRDRALDGATVQIYRIENGKFRMVRESTIPKAGFHASGWLRYIGEKELIPANTTSFEFSWDPWNRLGAKTYFTVRAVDYNGNYSAPSSAIAAERPSRLAKVTLQNTTKPYKASQLTVDSTPPPAPTNFNGVINQKGVLQLEWDSVNTPDLAGYVVYYSDYPPEQQKGFGFVLEDTEKEEEPIRKGDMVIVSKKFYTASRNQLNSNRVWGVQGETGQFLPDLIDFFPDEDPNRTWELARHRPDTSVDEPGETYLKLTLNTTNRQPVFVYNHGGTDQDWYPVLETKPYIVEVWMKSERPSNVEFKLGGFYSQTKQKVTPVVFKTGPEWKKYTATFFPPVVQAGNQPNTMALVFNGPGVFSLDNFRVYRADSEYLGYLPEEFEMLKASGVSALRTHAFIKTKFRTYDMDQLTNPGGVIVGTSKSNTLPQTLTMMQKAGVRPWLQIEPHMSPSEWLGLVEYLAAPYEPSADSQQNKPWAYKRYQQGQTRPWIDEFDQLYFEIGNETWNSLFAPWVFGSMSDTKTGKQYSAGETYGLYQEYVIGLLKSSPYWKQSGLERKVSFMLGGWNGQPFGKDAASVSPSSNYMTIAAYNGGWDEGEGPVTLDSHGLSNVLNQISQSAIPHAETHAGEMTALNGNRRRQLGLGTYEAGPGYAMNGLNGAKMTDAQVQEQERVMKSQAAGTATIDSFLARAYRGFSLQNFFVFGAGPYWTSHAKWYKGGQAYPSWKQIALFNNEAKGDMLRTEQISVPSMDLKAFDRRKPMNDAPLISVYATRKGTRYSVYVISRKAPDFPIPGDDGFSHVTLELPFKKAKAITLYRMAGNPAANNVNDNEVKIETIDIPASNFRKNFILNATNGATPRGVEPSSTYLYLIDKG